MQSKRSMFYRGWIGTAEKQVLQSANLNLKSSLLITRIRHNSLNENLTTLVYFSNWMIYKNNICFSILYMGRQSLFSRF